MEIEVPTYAYVASVPKLSCACNLCLFRRLSLLSLHRQLSYPSRATVRAETEDAVYEAWTNFRRRVVRTAPAVGPAKGFLLFSEVKRAL